MRKLLILSCCLLFLCLWGCSPSLKLVKKSVEVQGQTTEYVFATATDRNSGSFNVMDRYNKDGILVAKDAAMNPGLLPAILNGAVGSAFIATGLGVGLGHSGSNINQSNNGGSTGAISNSNAQGQFQGQGQSQSQRQRQGQGQGIVNTNVNAPSFNNTNSNIQGQSTGLLSPVTINP